MRGGRRRERRLELARVVLVVRLRTGAPSNTPPAPWRTPLVVMARLSTGTPWGDPKPLPLSPSGLWGLLPYPAWRTPVVVMARLRGGGAPAACPSKLCPMPSPMGSLLV